MIVMITIIDWLTIEMWKNLLHFLLYQLSHLFVSELAAIIIIKLREREKERKMSLLQSKLKKRSLI